MTPTEKLVSWNAHWQLKGGLVICRLCDAAQQETDSQLSFPHAPSCASASLANLPWQDLYEIQNPPLAP